VTLVNCLTACCPESGKIPLTFPNDREAISAALRTLRPYHLEDLKLVRIKNTLELTHLIISTGCIDYLKGETASIIGEDDMELEFDSAGDLISRLNNP